MFKKDQNDQPPSKQPQPSPAPSRHQAPLRGGGPAVIGPSITVKGDVSGDEDLVIQGRVQGTVQLAQHIVTIGSSGKVKANIVGKMVIVEGEVEGDLKAQEQIILRHTARVEGSISAPRVALEDGAVFRGGIEMDSASKVAREAPPHLATAPGTSTRADEPEKKAAASAGTPGKGLSA